MALSLGTAASDAPSCDPQAAPIVGGSAKLSSAGGAGAGLPVPRGAVPLPHVGPPVPRRQPLEPPESPRRPPLAKAECRAIQCLGPLEFDNGHFHPRQPRYNISQTLTFECFEGFTLRGPPRPHLPAQREVEPRDGHLRRRRGPVPGSPASPSGR
ncbi:unnamed protein product [Eretmochelys imbricata]